MEILEFTRSSPFRGTSPDFSEIEYCFNALVDAARLWENYALKYRLHDLFIKVNYGTDHFEMTARFQVPKID